MTTIILTIIGILLAAAAALMVIFYGGDAFNSGSIGAQANTLQNAGTNIESAATLYKVENAQRPANIAALTAVGADGEAYLKEAPALTGIGTSGDLSVVGTKQLFTVTDVADEVCAKVNDNVLGDETTEPTEVGATKMGCVRGTDGADGTFFASL